jgi:hypothetical protein
MRIDYDTAAEAAEKKREEAWGTATQIADKVTVALCGGRKIKRLVLEAGEWRALAYLDMVAGNRVHLPNGAGSFPFDVEPGTKGDA